PFTDSLSLSKNCNKFPELFVTALHKATQENGEGGMLTLPASPVNLLFCRFGTSPFSRRYLNVARGRGTFVHRWWGPGMYLKRCITSQLHVGGGTCFFAAFTD